jgi:hypothetical protein
MNFRTGRPLAFAVLTLLSTPHAFADESCSGLPEQLRNHLFRGRVLIHHTTNYKTDAQSFIGRSSECWLDRMPGGTFSGSGINCRRFIHRDRQTVAKAERMGYAISADAKITFLQPPAKYGPYDISCIGGKFAVVNTWDSIETFVFLKR